MQVIQQDWVSKWADYSPEKIALKEFETGKTITYNELNMRANRLANCLTKKHGLQKGDRIAVLSGHNIAYVVLFVAAQKTGIVLVPLNYRLASAELAYQLNITNPKVLIASSFYENLLREANPFNQAVRLLEEIEEESNNVNWDHSFSIISVEENDPIFILFTSGTTGFPKGAMYTHKMLYWNSINTAMSLIINSDSRTIVCTPPFHTGGWNVLLSPLLHHGGYSCLCQKFDSAAMLQLLEEEKATIVFIVPTMAKMIAEEAKFEHADLSSLFYLIVGGEPMPIPLIEQWHQKGIFVRQGYGMTEVGPNLTSLHQKDAIRKKGSIGKPNFYVKTKIVNGLGEELPPNEGGELLIQGPMVTPGYWQNKEATQKAIQEDWFHTGDMAKRDEDGYLFIIDRIKNMFISGGENVYPAEVERVLVNHSNVKEVVVIGVEDEKWGEVGKAFVVKEGEVTVESLQAYCRSKLAKFKVPKHYEFLEELPKNDTGKLNRRALK